MPIIFGIRRKAYRLATVFAVCQLCRTPAAQVLTRVRTFFTLFFLPVVPLGGSYRTTCTMCGGAVKVTKEDADRLVAFARSQAHVQAETQSQAAAASQPAARFPPPSAAAVQPAPVPPVTPEPGR